MRLIDADELLKAIANSGLVWETSECLDVIEVLVVKKFIDDAPTVEERSKGEWIHAYNDFYRCSLCGRGICTEWETEPAKYYPFCHCGADMRGENK